MKKKGIIFAVFLALLIVLVYSNTTLGLYEFLHKSDDVFQIENFRDEYREICTRIKKVPFLFPVQEESGKMEFLDSDEGKQLIEEFNKILMGEISDLAAKFSEGYVYFDSLTVEDLHRLRSFLTAMLKKDIKDGQYMNFFKTYLKVVRFSQDLSYGDRKGNFLPYFVFSLKIEDEVHSLMLDSMYRSRITESNHKLLSKFFIKFNKLFNDYSKAVENDMKFFEAGVSQYVRKSPLGSIIQGMLGRTGKKAVSDFFFSVMNPGGDKTFNSEFNAIKDYRKKMKDSSNLFVQRALLQPFEEIYRLNKIVELKRRFIFLSSCVNQYYLKNGKNPENLAELKVDDSLLTDPFEPEKPLKYKPSATSFVIYSSGFDGRDDNCDKDKDISTINYDTIGRGKDG